MNDYLLQLDDVLKHFLQRNIKFLINSQFYKEGKFIFYTHGYFSLNFNIKNYRKNKTEILKIPIPFDFEIHRNDNLLYFDYRVKTFSHNNTEIEKYIKTVENPILSRYFDKILTIEG